MPSQRYHLELRVCIVREPQFTRFGHAPVWVGLPGAIGDQWVAFPISGMGYIQTSVENWSF
ncbi:MAG: hypothetical protein ACK2UO_12390 [Caldilineaceae bacterium]